MTPHELYLEAARRGLRLEPAGDMLAVIPKGKVTPDFADVLRAHKTELLDWLNHQPCPGWKTVPPADLPLVTTVPRPSPYCREEMLAYLRRQTGDRPGPLTSWLVERETAYYDGPGKHWPCGLLAYSAARDAACWQLNRPEFKVWELLEIMAQFSKA